MSLTQRHVTGGGDVGGSLTFARQSDRRSRRRLWRGGTTGVGRQPRGAGNGGHGAGTRQHCRPHHLPAARGAAAGTRDPRTQFRRAMRHLSRSLGIGMHATCNVIPPSVAPRDRIDESEGKASYSGRTQERMPLYSNL